MHFYNEDNDKKFSIRIITVVIFVIMAIAGIGFSAYLIYISHSLYMYILAILFTVLSVISGFFNIFASSFYYRSYFYEKYLKKLKEELKPMKRLPAVAVVVPLYNEDIEQVEKNVLKLFELNYPKKLLHVYIADDSTEVQKVEELSRFCADNNIRYVHRDNRKGFKAGALNNIVRILKEEYIAIFDYDEYIVNKNFLMDLMPYFSDKKLAYIQTEKMYRKSSGLFTQSISLFDAFFFKFIQQARGSNNTAIFAGSCGIVNAKILKKLGGFPEYVIEDTFFSFEADMNKYHSLYLPEVYAEGKPIRSFTELVRQQWRYNYGDTQFLWYFYKHKKPKSMSPLSHIDYITHGFGLNYISVILVLFTLVSVMIVFSAVHFVPLTVSQVFQQQYIGTDLEIFGSIAFVLSLLTPVIITKIYFNSVKKGIMIFLLNFSLAIVRTKAAFAAILGKNPSLKWSRPEKRRKHDIIFAISNTKTELTMGIVLIALGLMATMQHNLAGGVWLLWYAVLYMLATMFMYKYG
ncbi:UDP-forming cellulose synthase catalytic subunit [mine drainage metagenome]|uniref:UDP-forming cellulose synthase catalytic subunit n=2 Tax=mine drainage metagenome TaxID=410659 RepID=T1AXJ5_9ZZZZ